MIIVFILFLVNKDHGYDKKDHHILSFGKILFIILILISAVAYSFPIFFEIQISNSPILFAIYTFFKSHIIDKTFLGLFAVFSMGSLFFIYVPLEISFLYFISELNPWFCLPIVLISILLGFSINYLLGLMLSKKIESNSKYYTLEQWVHKAGGILLVLFLFTPFPVQILTFILGGIKYPYKKMIIYSSIGILMKYFMLAFYSDFLIGSLSNIFSFL